MARKVEWTETAWSDLKEVTDYIARNSPDYGEAFVCEVRDMARSLGYLSNRGHVVPEFGDPTIREVFVKRYRLINQVRKRTVYIIGFILDHAVSFRSENKKLLHLESPPFSP